MAAGAAAALAACNCAMVANMMAMQTHMMIMRNSQIAAHHALQNAYRYGAHHDETCPMHKAASEPVEPGPFDKFTEHRIAPTWRNRAAEATLGSPPLTFDAPPSGRFHYHDEV